VFDNLINQGFVWPGIDLQMLRAYKDIYGAAAKSLLGYYLTPMGIAALPSVDTDCAFGYNTWGSQPVSSLFNLSRPAPSAAVAALRTKVAVGLQPASSPITLLHGTADPLIPYGVATAWMAGACAQGDAITLHTYAGAGHNPMPAPDADILNVIANRFSGTPDGLAVTASCP
jgi:pimeloyl-ACP methyl ester carboxylesterase